MPLILPLKSDWPILWKFADRLRELEYTEQGVSQAMGVSDHSRRWWEAWPSHVRRCRRQKASNPCALLAAFFLMEELLEESELSAVLGHDVVGVLFKLRWIVRIQDKLFFRFLLYPLLGEFFLTDGTNSNPNHFDRVYRLGQDSHRLARLTPRPKVALSLDHCTGSGVHAVLGAQHCDRAFGLDINPRALSMARINAKWNRRENAKFVASDCYQNVNPGQFRLEGPCQFDLITANPPFVPTPESVALFRDGGVSGEDVTEKIVRGLPNALALDGIFSMITNVPIFSDQSFFERWESWLGASDNWGITILSSKRWSVESYILGHQTPSDPETYGRRFESWLDAYESVKIEAITNSLVYIFRSDFPWRIHRRYDSPDEAVSEFIEEWIASLRGFDADDRGHGRLHPGIQTLCWNEDRTQAYLKWSSPYQWWEPEGLMLEGRDAQTLGWCLDEPKGAELPTEFGPSLATLWGHGILVRPHLESGQ